MTFTAPEVEQLLDRSHTLGADPRNTNYAGGNASAKGTVQDPVTAQDVELMWVNRR
jgi:rhamnose utilization protein RhaD (predicted bifunctional aldolase and dehydrogenase)